MFCIVYYAVINRNFHIDDVLKCAVGTQYTT